MFLLLLTIAATIIRNDIGTLKYNYIGINSSIWRNKNILIFEIINSNYNCMI